jgi:hypothetical protein
LTTLLNRRAFMARLTDELSQRELVAVLRARTDRPRWVQADQRPARSLGRRQCVARTRHPPWAAGNARVRSRPASAATSSRC